MRKTRAALALFAALALAGCEVYAVPSPVTCPGDRIGTFNFAGVQVVPLDPPPPAGCFFADPASPVYQAKNPINFSGSFYVGAPATPRPAALCIGAPHAEPRIGTLADDGTFTVAYVNLSTSIGGCTCPTAEAVSAGRCVCPPNTPLSGCSCPVFTTETIQGQIQYDSRGFPATFTGTQAVAVAPPPGSPDPSAACDCQVPCSFTYDLSATVVGAP